RKRESARIVGFGCPPWCVGGATPPGEGWRAPPQAEERSRRIGDRHTPSPMARYLQQVYCPQGFPLPVGSQAPTDQSPACAPMVRSFEPVVARSPVSVTIEQQTAREAVRNCCRT